MHTHTGEPDYIQKMCTAIHEKAVLQNLENVASRTHVGTLHRALDTRLIDPRFVVEGRYYGRESTDTGSRTFMELMRSVDHFHGNIQPIKVRPIHPGGSDETEEPVPRFQIVFGHRRYLACSFFGFPVLATIQDMPEREAFVEMIVENGVKGLSKAELGKSCSIALDAGLFPSSRNLATTLCLGHSIIARAIAEFRDSCGERAKES